MTRPRPQHHLQPHLPYWPPIETLFRSSNNNAMFIPDFSPVSTSTTITNTTI